MQQMSNSPLISDLSLENFPMPNLTEFLSLGSPNISSSQTHVPSILDVSLPRNQWYFQYENKLGTGKIICAVPFRKNTSSACIKI